MTLTRRDRIAHKMHNLGKNMTKKLSLPLFKIRMDRQAFDHGDTDPELKAMQKRAMKRARVVFNMSRQALAKGHNEEALRLEARSLELKGKLFKSDHSYSSPVKKMINHYRRYPIPTRGFFGYGGR